MSAPELKRCRCWLTLDERDLLTDALNFWMTRLDSDTVIGDAHKKAGVNVYRRAKVIKARLDALFPVEPKP